jgi:dTDP-4-dehydrorhamnose 3,5-epimerase
MRLEQLGLPGLTKIDFESFRDHRGTLSRCFDLPVFAETGLTTAWMQQVVSTTAKANTIRGMHVQRAPFTEAKLLVPLRGRMLWTVVDVRRGSPSFGHHLQMELSPERDCGLFVAGGFAHGCLSLSDDVALSILSDNRYSPEHGLGFRWDDVALGIPWPVDQNQPLVASQAHVELPSFATFVAQTGGITCL